MIETGLGLGRGVKTKRGKQLPSDACLTAAWILSGYKRYAKYFTEEKRPHNPNYPQRPTDDQVGAWYEQWCEKASNYRYLRTRILMEWQYFEDLFANVEDVRQLKKQLRQLKHRTVRDSYQRHQRKLTRADPTQRNRVKVALKKGDLVSPRWIPAAD